MDIESFREYALSLPEAEEDTPFDETTLVFKIRGRIFALTDIDFFEYINMKCDPDLAIELRDKYMCVKPGYHMNKKHWNSILLTDEVPDSKIYEWLRHSYLQTASKLKKNDREAIFRLAERDERFDMLKSQNDSPATTIGNK